MIHPVIDTVVSVGVGLTLAWMLVSIAMKDAP